MYLCFCWSTLVVIHIVFFIYNCSLGAFLCMYNGPLKGKLSSVPSFFINSALTPLLLSTHPRQFSFRFGIDYVLRLWYYLGWCCWLIFMFWYCWLVFMCWYCCLVFLCWYCWLVFLWVGWCWFGIFLCWNLFPKCLLTMGSII